MMTFGVIYFGLLSSTAPCQTITTDSPVFSCINRQEYGIQSHFCLFMTYTYTKEVL